MAERFTLVARWKQINGEYVDLYREAGGFMEWSIQYRGQGRYFVSLDDLVMYCDNRGFKMEAES